MSMAESVACELDTPGVVEDQQEIKNEVDPDEESHEAQIRAALNQQTIIQFRQVAMEKHPKEPSKQEELIRQLQERHYQQYVTQIYQRQLMHQRQQAEQIQALRQQAREEAANPPPTNEDGQPQIVEEDENYVNRLAAMTNGITLREGDNDDDSDVDSDSNSVNDIFPKIVPASMWTRRDIAEFKQEILSKQKECCIKVGSLATATIRVPTVPEGTSIFWEFSTDYYDIGFGVYFEWNLSPGDMVTVHISESSDEEDEAEGEGEEDGGEPAPDNGAGAGDVEQGGNRSKRDNRPPTDEIIPVYRRDSHEEVYCGSHRYPGKGVYLIKFDNSYSLWRSKWVYYRVYFIK